MAELSNVIQETSDYGKFKHVAGDRHLTEKLVLDIMDSFGTKPQLRIARPLLVNQKMEIIDGQHRLEASRRMKLPVYYMAVKDLTIEDSRLLNALQRSWSLADYARSYAETGNPEYIRFIELQKEYKVAVNTLLRYTSDGGDSSIARRHFKMGLFKMQDEERSIELLNNLREFSNYLSTWYQDSFAQAFLRLTGNNTFDIDRMMKKMEQVGSLQHRGSSADYLRDLEVIYNRNVQIGNQVRFI